MCVLIDFVDLLRDYRRAGEAFEHFLAFGIVRNLCVYCFDIQIRYYLIAELPFK